MTRRKVASTRAEPRHLHAVAEREALPSAIVPRATRTASTRLGLITFTAGRLVTEPALVYAAVVCGIPFDLPLESQEASSDGAP